MAPGLRVSIDGRQRTIPAGKVERFKAAREQLVKAHADDTDTMNAAIAAVALYLIESPKQAPEDIVPPLPTPATAAAVREYRSDLHHAKLTQMLYA